MSTTTTTKYEYYYYHLPPREFANVVFATNIAESRCEYEYVGMCGVSVSMRVMSMRVLSMSIIL